MTQGHAGWSAQLRRLESPRALIVVPLVIGIIAAVVIVFHSGFIDTEVYQAGAKQLLDDPDRLYEMHAPSGLPFTYPPFAAVLFLPLAALNPTAGGLILTLITVLCAIRIGYLASALSPLPVPAVAIAVSLLILEPGLHTLSFGQVNLVLMWLVFEGLVGGRRGVGDTPPWRAVLVGLAAGLKLIPLVFIGLLVLAGAWRRTGWAMLGLVASIGLGFAVAPGPSKDYWTDLMFDDTRIGGVEYVSNQSINGLLWRMLGSGGSKVGWFLLSAAVGLLLLWAARTAWRRADRLDAVVLTGLAGLLASPISWTHHWVWMPLIALVLWAHGQRVWAALGMLLAVSWIVWSAPHERSREFDHNLWQQLVGNSYVVFGLVAAGLLSYSILTDRRAHSPATDGTSCATM